MKFSTINLGHGYRKFAAALSAVPWLLVPLVGQTPAPAWTSGQWASWRDQQIRAILSPTYVSGKQRLLARDDVIAGSNKAYEFLAPYLADPGFLADPERKAVLANFAGFVTAQHWMASVDQAGNPTNALGMDIPDREYWREGAPFLSFPELLDSQPFLRCLTDPSTYKQAVDMIEQTNANLPPNQKWIAFPFRAQFIKSVDKTTYGRLLVLVPNTELPDGRLLDRWIQFGLATPDQSPTPRVESVSMISTVRDPAVPGQSKAYFMDFLREPDSSGMITPIPTFFLLAPSPSKNCYDCHKSAVLPIRPKSAYAFDSNGALIPAPDDSNQDVARVNRIMKEYGRSDLGHLDTEAYGPSLGSSQTEATDAFIEQSTKDQPISPSSYEHIRANMNCAKCHDQFAKIDYLIAVQSERDINSFEAKQGLVQTYIEKGYMPPNNTLTAVERHALWRCVMKQYLDLESGTGLFVDWLQGRGSSSDGRR
jgi:hypothetical protein